MAKNKKRIKKLLKWINEYGGWWYLICTPDSRFMKPETLQMIIRRLEQESLYELIFVIIMVHRKNEFINQEFKKMLGKRLYKEIKGKKKQIKRFIKGLDKKYEE